MNDNPQFTEPGCEPQSPRHQPNAPSPRRRFIRFGAALLLGYLAVAYALLPLFWKLYEHRHPELDDVPGLTRTTTGIPGDPINVALVGTRGDVERIMQAADWNPADALGMLIHDLELTGDLAETYSVKDFHKIRQGRNGGGDPWHTDGGLSVGVISAR